MRTLLDPFLFRSDLLDGWWVVGDTLLIGTRVVPESYFLAKISIWHLSPFNAAHQFTPMPTTLRAQVKLIQRNVTLLANQMGSRTVFTAVFRGAKLSSRDSGQTPSCSETLTVYFDKCKAKLETNSLSSSAHQSDSLTASFTKWTQADSDDLPSHF